MPAKYFKCSDGNTCEISKCLKQCRLNQRCMALPALTAVSHQRKWTGKPSVTQLIKPTRPAYLEIVNDFTIEPMNQIASMIGTQSHSLMEGNVPNGWLSEVRLEDDITSGQFDAYDCSSQTLWDYKFFGAFRVARALGHRSRWVNKGVYVRGAKKGQPKWEEVFEAGGVRDVLEIAIQLSYYKILLEKHNLPVKDIKVQMFLRGGLDATAKRYGCTQQAYIVPIHPISQRWVRTYMKAKYDALMEALGTNKLPPVCSKRDRWDSSKSYPDRKCRDWCSVNVFCPYYQEKYGE